MTDKKLEKDIIKKKKIPAWFCGCEKLPDSTGGFYEFDNVYHYNHEEYFSKKMMAKVYICHKNEKVFIKGYD